MLKLHSQIGKLVPISTYRSRRVSPRGRFAWRSSAVRVPRQRDVRTKDAVLDKQVHGLDARHRLPALLRVQRLLYARLKVEVLEACVTLPVHVDRDSPGGACSIAEPDVRLVLNSHF